MNSRVTHFMNSRVGTYELQASIGNENQPAFIRVRLAFGAPNNVNRSRAPVNPFMRSPLAQEELGSDG